PVNATICKAIGATASFSVVATPGATYQWQTQAATATTWTNVSNNANYSGATTATLNLTRTTLLLPATGTKFRVIVSNACGTVTSDVATLGELATLSKATAVAVVGTLTPVLTVCQGSTVNLSLGTGSIGNVDWMYSSDEGATWQTFDSYTQTSLSATNGVLTTTSPVLNAGTAWFKAVASNGVCTSMTSTNIIKLTVSAPAVAGNISGDDSICASTSSMLTLTGSTGTVVWQKSTNWTATTPTWTAITGATTTSLNTGALTATTAFRALLTNGACKATSDLYVVNVTPVAKATAISVVGTLSPLLTVCEGRSVNLSLATGSIGNIEWMYSTDEGLTWITFDSDSQTALSATNGVFTTTSPALQSGSAWFKVVATNGICSATSALLKITVSTTPVAGSISGGDVTVCAPLTAPTTLA
ncbi:hypothetical protein, partial [Flavobacterium aciduliphilum]|uniref:hypothetical protein n=1 Tax=Flavobacterium aciduliphilum TaxID=1101402 RepID=UPI001313E373